MRRLRSRYALTAIPALYDYVGTNSDDECDDIHGDRQAGTFCNHESNCSAMTVV